MMWAEVEIAKSEQRHELVLQGKDLTEKLERNEGRVDENIFSLVKLNFLELSQSRLSQVPDSVGRLVHLTSLVLKSNQLTVLPETLNSLTSLKLLDVSNNKISALPSLSQLSMLTTINLAVNSLKGDLNVPGLDSCEKLSVFESPHLPDGFLHHLAKVGLLLSKGNQLWLHLDPDCLHDLLDVLRDVEVESEHLAQHEGPLP